MHYATPLILLLSNPNIFFGLLFAFGVALFVVGGFIVRREPAIVRPAPEGAEGESPRTKVFEALGAFESGSLTWTRAFGDDERGSLDVSTRVDMIERLAMIGEPWCVDTLRIALAEERNTDVHTAAENALIVIKSR